MFWGYFWIFQVVEDTLSELEKRSTKTFEELEAEREEEEREEEIAAEEDEEGDEYVYNPLKLPLGPDGKPIPYWLWKLHGLQRKFTCEICGNFVYAGYVFLRIPKFPSKFPLFELSYSFISNHLQSIPICLPNLL